MGLGAQDENSLKARRLNLTEDERKKEINIVDMAYPAEGNKIEKGNEKVQKYQQLCFQLRERRQGYKVKVIPAITGRCGRGLRELKRDLRELLDQKTNERITKGMQKTVLWESETITRKIMTGLIK